MSWYASEQEWPTDRIVTTQARPPRIWPVRCASCPARTVYRGDGITAVHGQLELWAHGWRRDPDLGRDYCPDCAEA